MRNSTLKTIGWVGCVLLVCACGGSVELDPETTAHLAEYERLIEEFEPQFDRVRNDPPAFAKVAEAYRQRTEAWLNKWADATGDISDAEGKAIQAAVNKLNKRATKMLTGV